MRFFVEVISFSKHTLILFGASVANIWRVTEPVADLLLKVAAQSIAQIALRTTFSAARLVFAKVTPLAFQSLYATVANAMSCIFVAG
jgi:hypothetical protein